MHTSYWKCSYKKRDLVPLRTQVGLNIPRPEGGSPSLFTSPLTREARRQQQWIANHHPEEGPQKGLDQSLGLWTQPWPSFAKFTNFELGCRQSGKKKKKKVESWASLDGWAPKDSRGWKRRAGPSCASAVDAWDLLASGQCITPFSVCKDHQGCQFWSLTRDSNLWSLVKGLELWTISSIQEALMEGVPGRYLEKHWSRLR